MKTKNNARILAWLLSICMIVALIPAMPAEYAQAADGDTYVYDFVGIVDANTDIISQLSTQPSSNFVSEADEETLALYTSGEDTNAWKLVNAVISSPKRGYASQLFAHKTLGFALYVRDYANSWVDVVITVAEDGYYDVAATAQKARASKCTDDTHSTIYAELYSSSVVSEETKLSEASATTVATHNLDLGMHYLTAGEYAVRFKILGNCSCSNGKDYIQQLFAKNVTLTEYEPSIASNNSYPTAMKIGATAKLDVTGVSVGDSDFAADVAVSSSADCITVAEDGTLTAKSAGTSNITVTATYDEGKTVTETYVITVRDSVSGSYVYYMTGQTPNDTFLLTAAVGETYSAESEEWTLSAFTDGDSAVKADSPLANTHGLGFTLRGNDKGSADIKIKVPEAGWYSLSANVYESNDAEAQYTLKDGSGNVLASCDEIDKILSTETAADKVVYLDANTEYTFYFYAATGASASRQNTWLKYIKLTPESIDASAIFGNTYAYIRENKDGRTEDYTLVIVGAIGGELENYQKVGFRINGNIGVDEVSTQNVYTKINVGGTDYTAAHFGLTESDHIFYKEIAISADLADEIIEFYAFATPQEGSDIEGGKRTVAVVAE